MLNRRAFLVGLAAFSAPFRADAQQAGKVYRIGYLSPASAHNPIDQAFERSMRDLGYVEGKSSTGTPVYRGAERSIAWGRGRTGSTQT